MVVVSMLAVVDKNVGFIGRLDGLS